MKKTVIILIAVLSLIAVMFTGCAKEKDKLKDDMTTTVPTTLAPATNAADTTVKEDGSGDIPGAPESTNKDSALADAAEGAARGAARADERMAEANDKIADGIKNAQDNNR